MRDVTAITGILGERPPRCGSTRVVCIDGPAGSGKTTLAGRLASAVGGAPVVHLDDLYEGWHQDLGAPLASSLRRWLLDPWAQGRPGRFPRYDWAADAYGSEWTEVAAAPVAILEGCGSASRLVRSSATVVVWVQADPEVRLRRGLRRDGEAMAAQWPGWQRREARHFEADGTRAAADVVVRT